MPPPIAVELVDHDPEWACAAARVGERLVDLLGSGVVVRVHHIGSTAIPGICAKPILDLLPVVTSLSSLDAARPRLESQGFAWWGEFGLSGRRYCTQEDAATRKRLVQVHFYAAGDAAIARHVAFRDYLRAHPGLAAAYDAEKRRCRDLHPLDSHAYTECKGEWVREAEAAALRWAGERGNRYAGG